MNRNKEKKNTEGGFVMLYAILFTSVVLSIGFGLLELLVGQVSLSGTERESLSSFAAADSGLECAVYWDTVTDSFRSGTVVTCNSNSISCNGNPITVSSPSSVSLGSGLTKTTCTFSANLPHGNCANISIDKTTVNATGLLTATVIQSRGYNTVCPPAVSQKPWRLERGIEVRY
jgi:hypothetical protein